MKWVLAVGMLSWGIRYAIFALGGHFAPGAFYWPVILCLTLHGVCYDFFFAAGFIHVDNESPSDIKGSSQALFVFLTYGLGMWLGSELSGIVYAQTTTKVEAVAKVESSTAEAEDAAKTKTTMLVKDWYYDSGWVTYEISTNKSDTEQTDWVTFWLFPCVGVLLALGVFLRSFHVRPRQFSPAVPRDEAAYEVSGEGGISPVTGP
jgi:hypothetical protein